jgi:hypothetical protein
MSLDLEDIEPTTRTDYRRANGAPMVVVDGKSERYSRPSSYADPLDDKSALTNWKIDRGCIGVAIDRALQARWCALNPDDKGQAKEKEKLRQDSIAAGRGAEAADIGTALHAMSVRFEQEPFFSPPEPYLSSLMAYERELRLLGLKSNRFEFHVVNVEYRCAGTADRLYETTIPLTTPDGSLILPGEYILGDLKTGAKFEYSKPQYVVQQALYAGGQFYNVVTDEFEATPPIRQDWGLIVHMPADDPGTCHFLWCDLEVGRFGCYIVQQVKLWRKNWRAGEFEFSLAAPLGPEPTTIGLEPVDDIAVDSAIDTPPAADRLTVCPRCGGAGEGYKVVGDRCPDCAPEVDGPVAGGIDDGPDYPLLGYVEWIKLRLSYIARHEAASKLLMRLWPEGLPTPKQGIEHCGQVDVILTLLDKVEAEHQLGFVEMPESIRGSGPSTRKGRK